MRAVTLLLEDKRLTEGILKNIRERALKSFLDILILTEIAKKPLSGYDVISVIFKRYRFLISAGTIYSLLYKLERDGLIEGYSNGKKRLYRATDKGKLTVEVILKEPIIRNYLKFFINFFK
jgi:DNA-binding PadR family transcriptional regulator